MMITVRLYRQHDLDLIALYRHPSFSLPAAIKKALIAYVRQEQLIIKQPEPYEVSKEKISKIVQMHINLNETYDKDIIDWIKNTKEGYRNSVLKNMIRGYIAGPCIYTYQKGDNAISEATENNDLFDANIRNITTLTSNRASTPRKKTKKIDNRRVEDSLLAKQILSNNPTNDVKKDVIFVERIDDDDIQVEIPTAIKKDPVYIEESNVLQQENTKQSMPSTLTSEDDDDMWGDIDSMMDSF